MNKNNLDSVRKIWLIETYTETPEEQMSKKVFIKTWGCQMNVADSERMLGLLATRNYVQTENVDESDLVILNTCHIREKARHKLVSRLGEIRDIKAVNPNLIIAVSGCVAQAESVSLAKEVPYIDLIFGPDKIEELPSLLEKVLVPSAQDNSNSDEHKDSKHNAYVFTKFDDKDKKYSIPLDVVPPFYDETKNEVSRFVNIIKGCNNFCTFCVVPYTRGREKSRDEAEI